MIHRALCASRLDAYQSTNELRLRILLPGLFRCRLRNVIIQGTFKLTLSHTHTQTFPQKSESQQAAEQCVHP